jgi:hypothetical protein
MEKIIAGGDFVSYNGNTANKIIRLNTDGSIDGTFVSGLGFSSGVVEVIKLNTVDLCGWRFVYRYL